MEKLTENRERWAGVAIAALMPVALTWFACILVTSFIYLLTASAPVLEDITWSDTLHFGTSTWLLSVGATLRIGVARLSLIPLALTAVTWWLSLRSAKRALISTWEDVAVYTVVSALFAALLGFIDLEGTFLISAVIGAALLGFTASIVAWWRSAPVPLSWWGYVERGWKFARPMLLGALICASVVFLVALIVSFKRVGAIYEAYSAHWAGNIGITFVQLLYLPIVVVWALSFISGAPIQVGEGTGFSPFYTSAAPLPGIPVFGALPSASIPLYFLPIVLVVVGAVSAWWALRPQVIEDSPLEIDGDDNVVVLSESSSPLTFRERAINAGIGLALVFIALACAGALASGALGSGRMYEVGVNAPLFALLATAELALGLFAVLFLTRNRHAKDQD
ncbi:MAG: hypothetical protein IKS49_06185 [Actinomycetaceae bacterium]|nr:hypothetical protein [Actinomycetaceae bacterium]